MVTPTAEAAYLGSRHVLAAPLMALPEPAPALAPPVAPLAQPVTTTHRVITYNGVDDFCLNVLEKELTQPGKDDILQL